MKRTFIYIGCLLMAAGTVVTSCSEDETAELSSSIYPGNVEMVIPDEARQLIYTDKDLEASVLPLVKGETVQLGCIITPDDATFKDVVWTSSNEQVATVDADGLLKAVSGDGTGFSVVQVAPDVSYSGSGIASSLRVVVVNNLVPATSIAVASSADEVYAGEKLQFSFSLQPADVTYKTVKWSSSNDRVATVDDNGVVTGVESEDNHAKVTITATTLDGSAVVGSKEITVNRKIQPTEVTIDQNYSLDNGYMCAIGEKVLNLGYTTVPEDCTKSLIEWTSSDETIATVANGVVTFNQKGVFGSVTITAVCPETGNSSSIQLHLAEGLVRELFHDKNNYGWYNAKQSGNGTESSHVWSYGKVTVTTYTHNATTQRGDFRCWNPKTWLHAGNYPIFAIRMDDLRDMEGVTARNITLDASGTCDGNKYSGGLDGNNNKWLHDYKCSDGSHVFIYDLQSQKWATGELLPTGSVAEFTTLQFKYADIKTLDHQVDYNVYWVQTFKNMDDLKKYIESEGLTYDVIK